MLLLLVPAYGCVGWAAYLLLAENHAARDLATVAWACGAVVSLALVLWFARRRLSRRWRFALVGVAFLAAQAGVIVIREGVGDALRASLVALPLVAFYVYWLGRPHDELLRATREPTQSDARSTRRWTTPS